MDQQTGTQQLLYRTLCRTGVQQKKYSERNQYISIKYGKGLKEQAAGQIFYRI